jgi:anaerobic C4-dicarboxylate transporter DcuB
MEILEILAVSVPASLFGVAIAALWSLRRGKDLADDRSFRKNKRSETA